MKQKIYDGELVEIFLKNDELEVGKEADAALDVIVGGLIGAKTFASHLKDPMVFWNIFKNDVLDFLEETEKLILKQ
jgi:hypothetical protein